MQKKMWMKVEGKRMNPFLLLLLHIQSQSAAKEWLSDILGGADCREKDACDDGSDGHSIDSDDDDEAPMDLREGNSQGQGRGKEMQWLTGRVASFSDGTIGVGLISLVI